MLATHSVKLINAKAQQDAVCSQIIDELDKRYLTSQSIEMTKKYWSCPRSSANIKHFKDTQPAEHLPNIQDGRAIKQLLIPTQDWRNDNYISITPLESMGLLHELYLRLKDNDSIKFKRFLLEPNVPAWGNHGELMVEQKGRLYLLQRRLANIVSENDTEEMICVSFMAQGANITSGFVTYGHPAITAIGGLVHTLERAVGDDIKFAIGIRSIIPENQKRYNSYNKVKKKTIWGITNELTATLEIRLLLKSDNLPKLQQCLLETPILRFAGGSIWDYKVFATDAPPVANYLIDATCDIQTDDKRDVLSQALFLHASTPSIYSLNQAGYALLETPKERKNSRNSYKHAWAEPIYIMTKQSSFTKKAWWHRHLAENHIIWRGNQGNSNDNF
ncbi:MAG: type I-F CRISPR-associated protein Csy2 [Moraxella sp.]|nr:type I-F CRISPR-associated protein Csy2 [Moraxella sp.]